MFKIELLKKYMLPIIFIFIMGLIVFVTFIAILGQSGLTGNLSFHDSEDQMAAIYRAVMGCKGVKSINDEDDQNAAQIILDQKNGLGIYYTSNGKLLEIDYSLVTSAYEVLKKYDIILKDKVEIENLLTSLIKSDLSGSVGSGTVVNIEELAGNMVCPFINPLDISYIGDDIGRCRDNCKRAHAGSDIMAPEGSGLQSVFGGKVLWAGYNSSCGHGVQVQKVVGADTYTFKYCHLVSSPTVTTGQEIGLGTFVGKVGNTGSSGGNHLHISLFKNGDYILYPFGTSYNYPRVRINYPWMPGINPNKYAFLGSVIMRLCGIPNYRFDNRDLYPIWDGSTTELPNNYDTEEEEDLMDNDYGIAYKIDMNSFYQNIKNILTKNGKEKYIDEVKILIDFRSGGTKDEFKEKGCFDYTCIAYENGQTTFTPSGLSDLDVHPIAYPLEIGKNAPAIPDVTSDFGSRCYSMYGVNTCDFHNGIDIGADVGTPVFAMFTGIVDGIYNSGACGNGITVKHSSGFNFSYCHMQNPPAYKNGDPIIIGEQVGFSGNSGISSGPHLHIQIANTSNGQYYDFYPSLLKAYDFAKNNDCKIGAEYNGYTYHNLPAGLEPGVPPSGVHLSNIKSMRATIYGLFGDIAKGSCSYGTDTMEYNNQIFTYCKDQLNSAYNIIPKFPEAAKLKMIPRVVAASYSKNGGVYEIPKGTVIYIKSNVSGVPDYGYAIVADTGGKVYPGQLDLYMPEIHDSNPSAIFNYGLLAAPFWKLGTIGNITVFVTPYTTSSTAYIYMTPN